MRSELQTHCEATGGTETDRSICTYRYPVAVAPRRWKHPGMSRPRPRQALVCGALLAAAAACALPAGASRAAPAKTTVLHYAIRLPKTHRGKVVLLELRTQLPQNTTVGGTVAV